MAAKPMIFLSRNKPGCTNYDPNARKYGWYYCHTNKAPVGPFCTHIQALRASQWNEPAPVVCDYVVERDW